MRVLMPGRSFLFVGFFKMFGCFPHFILHANSLTVGTSYGKESQANEFSFTQFRSSSLLFINLLFVSVSALYRKKILPAGVFAILATWCSTCTCVIYFLSLAEDPFPVITNGFCFI